MVTVLPEQKVRAPVGIEVIQVRAALIGLLLSLMTTSVIPLFAAMLTVIMFAIYSNGHIAEDGVAGGTS